jgi:hypothetical protein
MRLPSRLEDERKSCVLPCLLFRQLPYFSALDAGAAAAGATTAG